MRLLKFPHATEPIDDVKAFRRDVRQMRKAFPAPCRVYVQLVPSGQLIIDGERVHSYINPLPNSWQILIEQNEHMSNCFYSLCHEWAHALAPPGSRKSHHTRFRDLHHKIVYHFIPDA